MEERIVFTDLEESFIICNTILSKINSLVPALKDWEIEDNDFVYIALLDSLVLEVNKYVEECERYLIPILNRMNKDWLVKIHSPLLQCIKDSRTRLLRNRHIAHPNRDYKGNFVFFMDTVEDSGISIGRFDFIFLGEFVKWLIFMTAARLKNEYELTMEKLTKITESERFSDFFKREGELKTYKDVILKVSKVAKECDRIFYSEFPDEEAWGNRT